MVEYKKLSLFNLLAEPSDARGVAMFEAMQHRRKYFMLSNRKAVKKKSKVSQPLPKHTKLKPIRKKGRK